MLRIGVVGDLSQQDPASLDRALRAALSGSELVVQLGDLNPGYDVMKAHLAANPGRLYTMPGNHDVNGPGDWDSHMVGVPRQWRIDRPEATLVGLDNANDRWTDFDDAAYRLLGTVPTDRPCLLFMHKSLRPLLLPDGTVSHHIMGETQGPISPRMWTWICANNATLVCGHYHGQSVMRHGDGPVIILEGRGGGAGPGNVGWSLIEIGEDTLTVHPFQI